MKFGLNQMMKTENDVVSSELVEGGVATDVVADSQEAIQEAGEIQGLAMAVEDYTEQLAGVEDLAVQHDVQVQVMDGDLSVNNHGKIESDGAEINIDIDAKELGASVGDDSGAVLTPESTDEQAEEAAAKLESDLASALANIGGSLRSGKFSKSLLGQKFENDMARLKGKKKYRYLATEGIGDVAKKVWEKIKAFFKMIWAKIKEAGQRFIQMFKANKSVLEDLKKKLVDMDASNFAKCEKDKVSPALAAVVFKSRASKEMVESSLSGIDKMATEAIEIIKAEAVNKDKDISSKARIEKIMTAAKGAADIVPAASFEGGNARASYLLVAPSTSGVEVIEFDDNDKTSSNNIPKVSFKTLKLKKEEFSSKPNKQDALIEIADDGIALCEALEGDIYKDLTKKLGDFEKDSEAALKELSEKMTEGEKQMSTGSSKAMSELQRFVPVIGSLYANFVARVAKAPSAYIAAIRNGISICSSGK